MKNMNFILLVVIDIIAIAIAVVVTPRSGSFLVDVAGLLVSWYCIFFVMLIGYGFIRYDVIVWYMKWKNRHRDDMRAI